MAFATNLQQLWRDGDAAQAELSRGLGLVRGRRGPGGEGAGDAAVVPAKQRGAVGLGRRNGAVGRGDQAAHALGAVARRVKAPERRDLLTLGSANLNEHSLFNDTEVNVAFRDAALVRETRIRLWAEHLERTPEELQGDPTEILDGLWRRLAGDEAHHLTWLPDVSRRARALLGPVQGLLVDG